MQMERCQEQIAAQQGMLNFGTRKTCIGRAMQACTLSHSFIHLVKMHARQAQQAQLGTYWSNQLSPTSPVPCSPKPLILIRRLQRLLHTVVTKLSANLLEKTHL